MSQNSPIIGGLDVPDDFPLAPLEQFHNAVHAHYESENEKFGHWGRAFNALHYRFLACAEADEAFRSSLGAAGAGPPQPERARQEIALFAFFSSGLSALECLGYGLYFAAAIVDPAAFTRPPHKIWFGAVANAYQERFASDRIAGELARVSASTELESWRRARNVLMHREAPGRHHTLGGPSGWLDEPLSTATTFDRRAWLAGTLTALLDPANEFAAARL